MFGKKIVHLILIFTLSIQLFPTNQAGRFFMLDSPDDDQIGLAGLSVNQLRQFVEEEHKDIHIEHNWVIVPFIHITNTRFHFSVLLPNPHPGAIHTPPPNHFA
jgi:hypothetical protein